MRGSGWLLLFGGVAAAAAIGLIAASARREPELLQHGPDGRILPNQDPFVTQLQAAGFDAGDEE